MAIRIARTSSATSATIGAQASYNLQVTPTLAAASLCVLLVVTVLFIAAERLRPAPAR